MALLTEAGFTADGDGKWTRDGEPLRAVLLTSTRPPNEAIATRHAEPTSRRSACPSRSSNWTARR